MGQSATSKTTHPWHLSSVKTSWLLVAIATLAVILYLNVLPNTFIFDDWQQVVENPFLRRSDGLREIFTTGVLEFMGPVAVSNFYRPLMHSAFYLMFRISGLNPAGYHTLSILLHAAICLLVYAVIARLSGRRLTAVVAALLFAAHPVHTEAVAWISAYPELLCAFLTLLVLWLYLRAEQAQGRARVALLVLTGPVFLLALLAKEIAVAVPLLLACYELLVCRAPWRATLRATWLAYASLAAAAAVYLAARLHALKALMPASQDPIPPAEHLWTAVGLFFRYFWVQVWPLELHAFYYLERNRSPLEPVVLAGLATLLATAVLGWWLYRRRRPEVLAVALYLLPLAPAFLLPYSSIGWLMAERYLYLPSVGFCWLLAAGLVAAADRWGYRPLGALFVIVLVACSVRTVLRNGDWSEEVAFYRRTVHAFPGFPHAYLNLGEALLRQNRLPEALEATQAAVRLSPTYPDPHINLGLICWRQGNEEAAIRHFQRAATLAERRRNRFIQSRALANLGVLYRQQGSLEEALAASRQALVVDPHFASAHNNLGYALLVQGQREEAIRHFRQALELEPTLDVAHSNLGLAYAENQEWEAALAHLRQAERLNPNSSEVHARLGEVHLARGKFAPARREFSLALQLDPGNDRARAGLRATREAQ